MSQIDLEIETVRAIQIAMMNAKGPHERGQHAKMNGCLEARFRVHAELPDALRVGLFEEASTYEAVIRYSGGAGKGTVLMSFPFRPHRHSKFAIQI